MKLSLATLPKCDKKALVDAHAKDFNKVGIAKNMAFGIL